MSCRKELKSCFVSIRPSLTINNGSYLLPLTAKKWRTTITGQIGGVCSAKIQCGSMFEGVCLGLLDCNLEKEGVGFVISSYVLQ